MKALILIIFSGMVIFVAKWYWDEWKKERDKRTLKYDMMYLHIQALIENLSVNDRNYKYIMNKILQLSQMKYKNKEKTTVLVEQLLRKFKA